MGECTAAAARAELHLQMASRMYAWKLTAPAELPDTNLARWRWKLSREVEPCAHLNCHTALLYVACHGVELHTRRVLDAGNVLHLLHPDHLHLLLQYRDAEGVSCHGKGEKYLLDGVHGLLSTLQCLAISSLLTAFWTAVGSGFGTPAAISSDLLAAKRRSRSLLSHSKMAADSRDSFLQIFFVLSIFSTDPCVEVAAARSASIRFQTSQT